MFSNAQNTNITGGLFSITVQGSSPLKALHKRVAPNAILNAGGRADEVRCHPGTRKEVLGRIEKWRDAQDSLTPPIFWLSGPAGAGKSAIVQTIAKRCKADGVPQANFFFFRTDTSRNSLSPLVATLVHQIILLYPSLRVLVSTVLTTDPLALNSILEDQLNQLIVTPLLSIRQSSLSYDPPLLLIDGLDECESEAKHSQQRILCAFDKILTKDPCLFRLLVASWDESQIQTAFNDISSQLLSLYLDDQYSPENDIRAFVNYEFKRVRNTHPLAHTLDATWPSVEDVEDIVKKSSGQFIYAATVMRFILDSSASPIVSLAMVQGAVPISTKSPFAYLDAIYTYILFQVLDQEALMDILHAQLLIRSYSKSTLGGRLVKLLEAYNPRYSNAMVQSCLADLTSLTRYTEDHQLLFFHASFPDYLLDWSRSEDHFVDIDVFNFKSQAAVWKACHNSGQYGSGMEDIAFTGLARLSQIPPGFLDTLMTLEPSFFDRSDIPMGGVDLFKYIHSLCACDDEVIRYKQVLRWWIYIQQCLAFKFIRLFQSLHSHWPPGSHRYLAMSHIERYLIIEPCGDFGTALRPETDSDTVETALWLDSLLHRIHREKYHDDGPTYNQLLRTWMSWATSNDIPLDGVDDLPKARWYCAQAHIEQNIATEPHGRIDIALRPTTDSDAREMGLWLDNLLHRIHREKYHNSIKEYNQLLQKWTSWATWNNVLLDGVDDLPKARWYCAQAHIERNFTTKPSGRIGIDLRPSTDDDACEIGMWLDKLLHRIHKEKYPNSIQEYNQLLQTWTSWVTWNDIPLYGVENLPNARQYLQRSRIEKWFTRYLKLGRRPE